MVPTALAVGSQDNETTNLWFGRTHRRAGRRRQHPSAVRLEKAAFRRAAAAAGVRYVERRAFDVLFNGFSVAVAPADRAKLAQLPGVKAIYPVEIIRRRSRRRPMRGSAPTWPPPSP